jgi:hypothetical protein
LGSVLGAKPSKPTRRSITREGKGADCGAFSISNYCFTWPRRLLQLQPSSPTSSLITFNFTPRRLQLQSSLPTSSLVANFNPHRLELQPSPPFNFQTPSLFYFLPFSLMPMVCLMQVLLDELVTQIIILSIKDEPVIHFLNLRNKICDIFRRTCDSDEVLLHVLLRDLREVCKNHYIRSCFERRFRKANHLEALCF